MRIDVQALREDDQIIAVNHRPRFFDVDSEEWRFEERITGEVRFHLVDGDVLARGNLHAKAVGRCVRCLESVPVELAAKINYIYFPASEEPASDVAHDQVHEGAPDPVYRRGEVIEPVNELRESLLLALPPLPHCVACEAKRDEPIVHGATDGEPEWKRRLREIGERG